MGKVEEVARAIMAKVPQGYGMTAGEALEYARAAIEAMREPSEAMILDGYNALMEWDARTGEDYGIGEVWRAMIDASHAAPQQGGE